MGSPSRACVLCAMLQQQANGLAVHLADMTGMMPAARRYAQRFMEIGNNGRCALMGVWLVVLAEARLSRRFGVDAGVCQ